MPLHPGRLRLVYSWQGRGAQTAVSPVSPEPRPRFTCLILVALQDGRTGAYCDEPLEPFCPNQCSGKCVLVFRSLKCEHRHLIDSASSPPQATENAKLASASATPAGLDTTVPSAPATRPTQQVTSCSVLPRASALPCVCVYSFSQGSCYLSCYLPTMMDATCVLQAWRRASGRGSRT